MPERLNYLPNNQMGYPCLCPVTQQYSMADMVGRAEHRVVHVLEEAADGLDRVLERRERHARRRLRLGAPHALAELAAQARERVGAHALGRRVVARDEQERRDRHPVAQRAERRHARREPRAVRARGDDEAAAEHRLPGQLVLLLEAVVQLLGRAQQRERVDRLRRLRGRAEASRRALLLLLRLGLRARREPRRANEQEGATEQRHVPSDSRHVGGAPHCRRTAALLLHLRIPW